MVYVTTSATATATATSSAATSGADDTSGAAATFAFNNNELISSIFAVKSFICVSKFSISSYLRLSI